MNILETRMHSSRMRTVRSSIIPGDLHDRDPSWTEHLPPPSRQRLPASPGQRPTAQRPPGQGHSGTETPPGQRTPWTETPLWTESQTGVKTLPSRNFVCSDQVKISISWPCHFEKCKKLSETSKNVWPLSLNFLLNLDLALSITSFPSHRPPT